MGISVAQKRRRENTHRHYRRGRRRDRVQSPASHHLLVAASTPGAADVVSQLSTLFLFFVSRLLFTQVRVRISSRWLRAAATNNNNRHPPPLSRYSPSSSSPTALLIITRRGRPRWDEAQLFFPNSDPRWRNKREIWAANADLVPLSLGSDLAVELAAVVAPHPTTTEVPTTTTSRSNSSPTTTILVAHPVIQTLVAFRYVSISTSFKSTMSC